MNYEVQTNGSYKVTANYRGIHQQTLVEGKAATREAAIVICETVVRALISNDRFERLATK